MEWSWAYFFSKLTSRKLWLAIASFVASLIIAFGGDASTATQISGLIGAVATVAIYCISNILSKNTASDSLITTDVLLSAFKTIAESNIVKDGITGLETKLRAWLNQKQALPDEKIGGTE